MKSATPSSQQLTPAATEAELRWFRKKQLKVFGRSMLLTAGAGALWLVGALLRDPARSHDMVRGVEMGIVGLLLASFIVSAFRSANFVRDIQSRRDAMKEEQRQRIFLKALDDDAPVA